MRLTIDSLAFGGDGVGRGEDGRVVFVPGAAPGDEVEVVVVESKKGYARARLEQVVCPSPERVDPPCPLFARADCGGCQWQHVAAAGQRRAKEEVVRRALRHLAPERAVAAIETPAPEYRWRRRARLRWRRVAPDAPAVVGYAARRSHLLVDVPACPQLEEPLERALACVRDAFAGRLDGAGDLELLLGGRGDVHVALDGPGVRALAAEAAAVLGRAGIVGIVLRDAAGADAVGTETIDLADDGGGQPFLASAEAFAQVSAPGNDVLRRLVAEGAGDLTGARVLELHAGSGNFTRDLAARAAVVVAVEAVAAAVALGTRNLALRGLEARVAWRREPAEAALAALAAAGERFQAIVLDPPRTGLEARGAEALARLGAGRVVYVSCDPNTLARDVARMAGYTVERATPVDLMPQTYHVEVVAVVRPK